MKIALFLLGVLPLFGGDLERFTDNGLNYTQRNTACLSLRGIGTDEVIAAMRSALDNNSLQACAAANLRIAGASNELAGALKDPEPTVRAVAARELGTMRRPGFIALLRAAADDRDLLVASNAVEGLSRYDDHSSAPQLREIAVLGGVLTALALDTLVDWHDPEAPAIARRLMARKDPGDQLAGIRAIGIAGNAADLPRLRELAKDDVALGAGARGFGLMPVISISRAAKTAIQNIEQRAAK